jgi:hypothetical protein
VLKGKGDKGSKKGRKEEIGISDPSPKNLADRVFVVQFRDSTEPGSRHFAGRAEHVMSGENTVFETPDELVDFLGRVMKQLKPRSQKGAKQ